MAVSHALLRGVARGELPETARVFTPGPTMAFGRLDALAPGYARARAAAAARGWTPVLRLGGGHAAGYDHGCVVFELVTRTRSVAEGIEQRFAAGVGVLVAALGDLEVAVEVGELAGEYCPGRWSVHLRAGPKVAGAAQRSIRGASLLTAVVVVEQAERLREALVAVYDALAIAWDPRTFGSVSDRPASGAAARRALRGPELADALARRLAADVGALVPATLDAATLAAARALLPAHAS